MERNLNVAEILKEVIVEGYDVVAVRHCTPDENYVVGDICRNSYGWDYNNDCSTYGTDNEIELDGTCAIRAFGIENLDEEDVQECAEDILTALNNASIYFGKVAIIAGYMWHYGDEDEVIIRDAKVLWVQK